MKFETLQHIMELLKEDVERKEALYNDASVKVVELETRENKDCWDKDASKDLLNWREHKEIVFDDMLKAKEALTDFLEKDWR